MYEMLKMYIYVDSLQEYTVPSLYSSDRAALANTTENIAVRIKTVFHTADILYILQPELTIQLYLPAFIHFLIPL